jgi:hypothetical protein
VLGHLKKRDTYSRVSRLASLNCRYPVQSLPDAALHPFPAANRWLVRRRRGLAQLRGPFLSRSFPPPGILQEACPQPVEGRAGRCL